MEGKGMRVWALLALLALAGCADDEARDAARLYEEAVNVCQRGGHAEDCRARMSDSLRLDPNQAFALLTFGHASRSLAKFSDAAEAYGMVRGQTRAHAGSESAPPPWARREAGVLEGKMHIEDNHWDEAIWAFERTYASHPDSSEALFRLLYLQHFSCNFTNRGSLLADARTRAAQEAVSSGSAVTPSQALMFLDAPHMRAVAHMYAEGHALAAREDAGALGGWVWDLPNEASGGEGVGAFAAFRNLPPLVDARLRVAYLSKDWGFSSVGQLLPRLLASHDRRRIAVTVLCLNPSDESETRRQLEGGVENWVDIVGARGVGIAEQINSLGINILLDLGGHLSIEAQVALALRPAPVAMGYLSWLSSSASDYLQHFVSDRVVTPVEYAEADFSEALAFLPHSYQVNSNRFTHGDHAFTYKARHTLLHPGENDPLLDPLPAPLDEKAVIFGNFNQLFKVGHDTFRAISQILKVTDNSVLAILNFTGAPDGPRGLPASFSRDAGIDARRVRVAPFCVSKFDFLRLASGADIFLDNFFYNAGTTGGDVLFAGVPTVTLAGRRTLARMGASMALAGLAFPLLIARTEAEYVALAVRLAARPLLLARIRLALSRQVRLASLFDADRWAVSFETLLFSAWDAALIKPPERASRPPKPVDLGPGVGEHTLGAGGHASWRLVIAAPQ